MDWISSFIIINLIGISTNIDNIGVGFAYGIKNFKIPIWFNLIINFIGFITTIIGVFLGNIISQFISQKETGLVSFCILLVIGLFIIYNDWLICRKQSEKKIQKPSVRNGIFLGLTLSFTNIASGLGATIAYNSFMWLVICSITIWGYLAIWLGNSVGNNVFPKIFGNYSPLIAGLILIAVGFKQLF